MERVARNLTEIGDIKEMRKNAGLTQAVVAKYCGVSLQAYYRWEDGLTKSISEERFEKLKDILTCKPNKEDGEKSD